MPLESRLRVGFFSFHNYFDQTEWSGGLYRMYHALRERNEVIPLGNPMPKWKSRLIGKLRGRARPDVGTVEFAADMRSRADRVVRQLRGSPCDVLFAPVASQALSFFQTTIPIAYLSDATFRLLKRTYPSANRSETETDLLDHYESEAIARASHLIYPSQWAADSAEREYGAPREKISVIPMGANIDDPGDDDRDTLRLHRSSPCTLLFIGLDWERKGGAIAFDTLRELTRRGIDARLVIVGCIPPPEFSDPRAAVISFLDRNSDQGRRKFEMLLQEAHFLLVPTRAECFGFVFCEAAAFGAPVLATDVGGVPTIVRNGETGYLLATSARGAEFADKVVALYAQPEKYAEMRRQSRRAYVDRLNWSSWANSVTPILNRLKLSA